MLQINVTCINQPSPGRKVGLAFLEGAALEMRSCLGNERGCVQLQKTLEELHASSQLHLLTPLFFSRTQTDLVRGAFRSLHTFFRALYMENAPSLLALTAFHLPSHQASRAVPVSPALLSTRQQICAVLELNFSKKWTFKSMFCSLNKNRLIQVVSSGTQPCFPKCICSRGATLA